MAIVRLLGTGTPNVDPERAGSGTAVVVDGGWLLVDCGRGVAQRIAEARLDVCSLRAVLVTHHHSDHISDLATIATMRWIAGASTPLVVVAPHGPCSDYAAHCLDPYPTQAFHGQASAGAGDRPTIDVHAFVPSDEPLVVDDDGGVTVTTALVAHPPIEAAVGYRIDVGGAVVAVSGDTAVCRGIEQLATDADLLVHEAVRADLASPQTLTWNASAASVGALAERVSVRHLVLTHLLPAPTGTDDEEIFVAQARAGGFGGPITVARDHLTLDLPRRSQ